MVYIYFIIIYLDFCPYCSFIALYEIHVTRCVFFWSLSLQLGGEASFLLQCCTSFEQKGARRTVMCHVCDVWSPLDECE